MFMFSPLNIRNVVTVFISCLEYVNIEFLGVFLSYSLNYLLNQHIVNILQRNKEQKEYFSLNNSTSSLNG
jgi:hypothetical protein